MPKPTRDQQFQKSFAEFFDTLTENFYPNLKEYTLESKTLTKNRFDHVYTLTFPRNVVSYYVDVFTINEDGTVTPAGPVTQPQDLPPIRTFKTQFRDYFKKYNLKIGNKTQSYTDIDDYWYSNSSDEKITSSMIANGYCPNDMHTFDINFKIDIIYHKSHIPFPVPISTKEQFEKKCQQLEAQNAELVANIHTITNMYQEKSDLYDVLRRRMRIDRRNMEEKYRAMLDNMQKKFREMYSLSNSSDDCPVCYETIESTKLKVPGCLHTICTDCSERCSRCPICRDTY